MRVDRAVDQPQRRVELVRERVSVAPQLLQPRLGCLVVAERLRADHGQRRQRDGRRARSGAGLLGFAGAAARRGGVGAPAIATTGRRAGSRPDSGLLEADGARRARAGRRGSARRSWPGYSPRWALDARFAGLALALLLAGREREPRGLGRHLGLSIWPRRWISRCHWSGFRIWLNCFEPSSELGPCERLVADVDVVVVVGHRERVAAPK